MNNNHKNRNVKGGFVKYFRETWRNKLCACALLIAGMFGVILETDATALITMALFAVPMFFSREDWFN